MIFNEYRPTCRFWMTAPILTVVVQVCCPRMNLLGVLRIRHISLAGIKTPRVICTRVLVSLVTCYSSQSNLSMKADLGIEMMLALLQTALECYPSLSFNAQKIRRACYRGYSFF